MSSAPVANSHSLVADIGGTNTRVALADGTQILPDTVQKFRNAEFPDLESVLRAYFSQLGNETCKSACVAVAGPVQDGIGELTNLDWTIECGALMRATGAKHATILNDLQAQGHALGHIHSDNLHTIIARPNDNPRAPCLVIGVGTGFNAAPVYPSPDARLVAASEAGHVNLPIQSPDDQRLWQYLTDAHGFASVEDALSGRGLEQIYAWHCSEAGISPAKSAADIFAAFESGTDKNAVKSAATFAQMLGAVAGNLALTHLPFGGIYLAGGVSRVFAPHLHNLGFETAFCNKGRFSEFMESFEVTAIEDDFAALSGCASYLADSA